MTDRLSDPTSDHTSDRPTLPGPEPQGSPRSSPRSSSPSDEALEAQLDSLRPPLSPRALPRVRALVIYQHAFLRDLVTKVLGSSGVEIVAAIRPDDLDDALLELLKPEVLVIDQAAFGPEGTLKATSPFGLSLHDLTLLGHQPEVASRIVLVDLSDPKMLVWQRHLVTNTDAEKLVQAVREPATASTVG